ncbi:MAG TPA: hypothetical protein VMN39_02470 [Longimicrobiaceae bacterium]|nr:hypothetical protein [Longimicrobiaceae bacterium]
MDIPNPIHPDHLSPKERLAEVCGLLARGLVRLRLREGQVSAPAENFSYTSRPTNAVMRTATHQGDA